MSNLNEEDIAEYQETKEEIIHSIDLDIKDLLCEWEDLIEEASCKEVELFQLKEWYSLESEKIISETDFKALYGKNNADVRKQHVKTVLRDQYDSIKVLEFSLEWIGRRISFIRELVKWKRTVKESEQ